MALGASSKNHKCLEADPPRACSLKRHPLCSYPWQPIQTQTQTSEPYQLDEPRLSMACHMAATSLARPPSKSKILLLQVVRALRNNTDTMDKLFLFFKLQVGVEVPQGLLGGNPRLLPSGLHRMLEIAAPAMPWCTCALICPISKGVRRDIV